MTQREIELALPQFEGLVFETARQIVAGGVELELDDVCQLLRVKIWHAVQAYDAARDQRLASLQRFVFGCVYNLRKDLEKRPRRFNASIDELRAYGTAENADNLSTADRFDAKYLAVDAERVFAEVEERDESPIPPTLTSIERRVVALKLNGRLLLEIDRELGLSRAQRERVLRSAREKIAAWCPNAPGQRSAPTPPLPHGEPVAARLRAALAA